MTSLSRMSQPDPCCEGFSIVVDAAGRAFHHPSLTYWGKEEQAGASGMSGEEMVRKGVALHAKVAALLKPDCAEGRAQLDAIEQSLGVEVVVEDGPPAQIVVLGDSVQAVDAALAQVQAVIKAVKATSGPYTHFINLRVSEGLRLGGADFAEKLRSLAHDGKLPGFRSPSIVDPGQYHVTLCMLRLRGEEQISTVIQCLQNSVVETIKQWEGGPAVCSVRGIGMMNDDVTEVDVVYAKIQDGPFLAMLHQLQSNLLGSLQQFNVLPTSELQKQRFYDAKGQLNGKFHVTVINTKFGSSGRSARVSFDATELFDQFGEFDFGSCKTAELHVSRMDGKQGGRYWPCIHSQPFP